MTEHEYNERRAIVETADWKSERIREQDLEISDLHTEVARLRGIIDAQGKRLANYALGSRREKSLRAA